MPILLFFTKDLIPLMSLLACFNHSTLFLSALTIGIVDCIDMVGQILKGPEDEFVCRLLQCDSVSKFNTRHHPTLCLLTINNEFFNRLKTDIIFF